MICSPSKKLLIFLLIATAQLTMGCRAKYDVKLLNLKEGTEEVFCREHPNLTRAKSLPGRRFSVSVWHDSDLKKNVAIISTVGDDGYSLTVGHRLQEGDTFSFKNVKWKILKIGTDGVTSDGEGYYCERGFIHINRLESKPKT
jgi:hypothetical protein